MRYISFIWLFNIWTKFVIALNKNACRNSITSCYYYCTITSLSNEWLLLFTDIAIVAANNNDAAAIRVIFFIRSCGFTFPLFKRTCKIPVHGFHKWYLTLSYNIWNSSKINYEENNTTNSSDVSFNNVSGTSF
jgi:hypothetical protein